MANSTTNICGGFMGKLFFFLLVESTGLINHTYQIEKISGVGLPGAKAKASQTSVSRAARIGNWPS